MNSQFTRNQIVLYLIKLLSALFFILCAVYVLYELKPTLKIIAIAAGVVGTLFLIHITIRLLENLIQEKKKVMSSRVLATCELLSELFEATRYVLFGVWLGVSYYRDDQSSYIAAAVVFLFYLRETYAKKVNRIKHEKANNVRTRPV